jgi:hypothetical protein
MKLWIARTEANIPYDVDCSNDTEKLYYTKLYVLYDKPSGNWNDLLRDVRKMCEVPNYMFPEIKEKECVEFESTIKIIENYD